MVSKVEAGDNTRNWIIGAALLALFLGALDALVMTVAMPTIIAELGGMHLYAWTYTVYFLARAVSLPIFGKLSDMYSAKGLFLFSISLFTLSSLAAGLAPSMVFLVTARVFQGLGCGGVFALVYVVLSDVSSPDQRAKTISFASAVWGVASLIGPTLGGLIVTWVSWRWIFFINIPLGLLSFLGVALYFREYRPKKAGQKLDLVGAGLLSSTTLGLLLLLMTGGREQEILSASFMLLALTTTLLGAGFFLVESRAENPMLNLAFFRDPSYALGNALVFFASFAIFSLFAYAPILMQGGMSHSPLEVGYAMLSLSLGWSLGALAAGRKMQWIGQKRAVVIGATLLVLGSGLTLGFTRTTSVAECFGIFLLIGLGMGFVSLTTLLIVQESVSQADLGVATSFHQFSRTMGGAFGVGFCGGVVTEKMTSELALAGARLPAALLAMLEESLATLFEEEFLTQVPAGMEGILENAVVHSLFLALLIIFVVCLINLGLACILPGRPPD
jgi:EmrB/QacA subfamily drug resistance transporter